MSQAHPGALPEGEFADTVVEESLRMQRLVEQMLVLTRTDESGVRDAPRGGPRRPRARVRRPGYAATG